MKLRDPSPFGWDTEHERPILRLESDKAKEGIEMQAFGSDYEKADTLFAVFADGERILTRRPEPLLVTYVRGMAEAESFTLVVSETSYEVTLDADRQERLETIADHLEDGLKNTWSIIMPKCDDTWMSKNYK